MKRVLASLIGNLAIRPQWYAFNVLTHVRIGPFWTKAKAADVSSDMQEHLMFMNTLARADSAEWITVNERWMKLVGVL